MRGLGGILGGVLLCGCVLASGYVFSNMEKVKAGYVGVKVYLLGGKKGVSQEELGVGRYWIGFNEELYRFPTFTQNYVWTKDPAEGSKNDESILFQTSEGMSVGTDVGISYNVRSDMVGSIFQKYRRGIDEITDTFLRNMVRDAFVKVGSTKSIEDVYGSGKTEIIAEVEQMVRDQVDEIGINVERIYLIGKMRLPKGVVVALNAKIAATQKAQQRENEVAEAIAAAEKGVATAEGAKREAVLKAEANKQERILAAEGEAESIELRANAQAEANRKLAESLTPELIEYERVKKWNGTVPRYQGGGVTPFMNIDK